MNVIVVMSDTFRRDHLGCYGSKTIHTPVLDGLAAESVVFDQAYCCSFPTLPCRAEIFTGRFIFPWLEWGPLPTSGPLLSSTLANNGYTCTMVTDNIAVSREGFQYDAGFHSRIRIRGQTYDRLAPKDTPFQFPCNPEKLERTDFERIQQYLKNVAHRKTEEDWFAPQVVNQSIRWLEENHKLGKFFLWIDVFDPHQPWDPPKHYVDRYDPDGNGEDIIYPSSRLARDYAPEDLKRMKALYAGEVTMVDTWVGKLLQAVDDLGLREDTVFVFMSDHGILLGEHGYVGKMGGKKESMRGWPNYAEIARVPMMFRVPGIAPGRRSGFVHPGDISPTLLDLVGVKKPAPMKTRSLARVLRGEEERVRDFAVSSWSLAGWSAFRPSVIRTDEWALMYWRAGVKPQLYHLPSDPNELDDVYDQNRGVAADLHRKYVQFLRENDTPINNLIPRLSLASWGKGNDRTLMIDESDTAPLKSRR